MPYFQASNDRPKKKESTFTDLIMPLTLTVIVALREVTVDDIRERTSDPDPEGQANGRNSAWSAVFTGPRAWQWVERRQGDMVMSRNPRRKGNRNSIWDIRDAADPAFRVCVLSGKITLEILSELGSGADPPTTNRDIFIKALLNVGGLNPADYVPGYQPRHRLIRVGGRNGKG
jgi:hypothetical protein